MKNNEKDILKDFAIKITERNLSVAAIFFLLLVQVVVALPAGE